MLKRKAIENLLDWKNNTSNKALIINGARQVGKTYIVRVFGAEYYESFIELNFIENPDYIAIFDGNLSVDSILGGIGLFMPDSKIVDGRTLIFLDEIQDCPNAITALKFLAADSRFDVIASGSALGMNYKRGTSYPVGSVEYLDMTALDFREFLWAIGVGEEVIANIRGYFDRREEVPKAINDKMMEYLLQYMVVGGMPEVVAEFVQNKDYSEVDKIQKRIYRDYIADIARYAIPDLKIKAENCFKAIPRQLTKDNHKYQYSLVENKGTARKFESSVEWICNANMAQIVNNISYVEYPLENHSIEDNFRLYMTDIGLLVGTYDFALKKAILSDVYEEISDNLVLRTAKGGLYEALIADMLYKNGHSRLYFYRNEAGTAELEFFIEDETGVVPIEVKAGRKRARTLDNILKKDDISKGYKLASQNIGVDGKKITLPLYMAMFL